jgi:AraC-like DNA-binding protein
MLDRSSKNGLEVARDPLSEVLADLRLSGLAYGYCEMGSPWGVEFSAQSEARLHFVISGRCWLQIIGSDWIALNPGDVVLLPQGAAHLLANRPGSRTRPLESFPITQIGDRTHELKFGGTATKNVLVCCVIRVDDPSTHPLLKLMPATLVLRRAGIEDPMLIFMLNAIGAEIRQRRIGAATLLTNFADIVFTKVVRLWLESNEVDNIGWLAGIRDPQLGSALAAIHRSPGKRWTLAKLAATAGASRSHFAAKFASVLGVPPAQYLAHWRMQVAKDLLRRGNIRISEVAYHLGYESEASFSRAFKRILGVAPSKIKPNQRLQIASSPTASLSRSAEVPARA